MKFFVLLVFFVYLTLEISARSLDVKCGIKGPENSERIINGTETGVHEFPWQVVGYFGIAGCGGSIIDKQWVITAAHCVVWGNGNVTPPEKITLYFATHKFHYFDPSVHDQSTFTVPVAKVFPNPAFNYKEATNDIALLKLAKSLPLDNSSAYVSPICLPEIESSIDELAGSASVATGYGSIEDFMGDTSSVLLKTNLTIVKQEICRQVNPGISNDVICAGADGHDVCTGDSGSSLITFNSKTNRWQLTGITSYGDYCIAQLKHPSVFTRVSHYLTWIHDIMSTN